MTFPKKIIMFRVEAVMSSRAMVSLTCFFMMVMMTLISTMVTNAYSPRIPFRCVHFFPGRRSGECSLRKNTSIFFPSYLIPQYRNLKVARTRSCVVQLSSTTGAYGEGPSKRKPAGADGYSIVRQPVRWGDDEQGEDVYEKWRARSRAEVAQPTSHWMTESEMGITAVSRRMQSQILKSFSFDQGAREDNNIVFDKEEASLTNVNLHKRSLETLDYPRVLQALIRLCRTAAARQVVSKEMIGDNEVSNSGGGSRSDDDVNTMKLSASDVHGVHARFAAVREMQLVQSNKYKKIKRFPIEGSTTLNLQPLFEIAEQSGRPLEGPEIMDFALALDLLADLACWCQNLNDAVAADNKESDNNGERYAKPHPFVELPKLGKYISIDPQLKDMLDKAFDDRGRLNGITFPVIGSLRAKIKLLKNDILETVNNIIQSRAMSSKLALESGGNVISEVNGRIVVPVEERYKNTVGIVHDTSRSGKTVYVEPTEIVAPTNEMRQAEFELAQEEARIWRLLTADIMNHRGEIETSVAAAGQLDLVVARARLGEMLQGVIPEVRGEGVIHLDEARHPVLLLRELDTVIGSSVNIGANGNQGLVLTGPNSGGKTIILKLMGLVALMVRDGIPIPASGDGARVDFFSPILADIGDIQSVGGDLSTFSGHMLVCREVLAKSGRDALVLMDELGSGTDPAQGVALAQAILEALVDSGARVAITTHYTELKQLAAADSRFAVAGMQFVSGRPTYKLLPGVVGESFALAMAERLELPDAVLQRADELLDSDTRKMGDLIRDLEEQKAVVDRQAEDLSQKRREMDELKADLERSRERMEQLQLNARRDEAKKFAKKLEEKEVVLEDILERLKSDPSKRLVARSWDDIKYVKRDALKEAEFIPGKPRELPSDSTELIPITELDVMPQLKVGDSVIVCRSGAAMGKEASLTKISPKSVNVSVGSMPLRLKLSEIALPSRATLDARNKNSGVGRNELSKVARRALAQSKEIDISSQRREFDRQTSGERSKPSTMRTSSNTIDLRGCNLMESKERSVQFFSKMSSSGRMVVYLLHGHGSGGVLKQKLRDWLKREGEWVKRWKPADPLDGGDGFTMVELKKLQIQI